MWHGDPMLVNKKSSVYFDLLSIHTIISNSMSQFQCVRTAFNCKSYPFLKLSELLLINAKEELSSSVVRFFLWLNLSNS